MATLQACTEMGSLSVRDAFEQALQVLQYRLEGIEVSFRSPVRRQIVNGRTSSFVHASILVAHVGGKTWCITRGVSELDADGGLYDSDISLFRWPGTQPVSLAVAARAPLFASKAADELRHQNRFDRSLLVGMANGAVSVSPDSAYCQEMQSRFTPRLRKLIATPGTHPNDATLVFNPRPVSGLVQTYRLKFPDLLAETIEEVIKVQK